MSVDWHLYYVPGERMTNIDCIACKGSEKCTLCEGTGFYDDCYCNDCYATAMCPVCKRLEIEESLYIQHQFAEQYYMEGLDD